MVGGGVGERVLKKQTEMNRRGSSVPLGSLCEKKCVIFQTASRVLSDKLIDKG